MWFFTTLSWVAFILQLGFAILSLAAGLYYLAELVEEYTAVTAKIIKYQILFVLFVHIGFLIFEDLPVSLNAVGITNQVLHLCLLATFPVVQLLSPSFIAGIVLLLVHHFLAFKHFSENYYSFSEVIAYFTICLWFVPFAFFISLTANDNTLPVITPHQAFPSSNYGTTNNAQSAFDVGSDVVTNYFSSHKRKKYGLLSLFNYAKDFFMPERQKRFT